MARQLDIESLPVPATATVPDRGAGERGLERVRRWWRRFSRNRGAVFGLAVFLAIVLMALFADALAPHDPLAQGVGPANAAPSWAHPFAVSEFEAKTDGRVLGFSFRLDTTSVVDLVNRARPAAARQSACPHSRVSGGRRSRRL